MAFHKRNVLLRYTVVISVDSFWPCKGLESVAGLKVAFYLCILGIVRLG